MFRQVIGTAMGTIFAPPYACLVIGYLEETKLYPKLLPEHFDPDVCLRIIEHFYRLWMTVQRFFQQAWTEICS